jgi:ketosteroid isomerase-like protein
MGAVLQVRDTPRTMPEESTTPDLEELVVRAFEAMNRRDFEALESFYAPDASLTLVEMGATFEGPAAIRDFAEDFVGSFEHYEIELNEVIDLGNGVCFGVYLQQGRPIGSTGLVQMRTAIILLLVEGMVVRHMMDTDIDRARAAAERLAESRR